MPLEGLPLMNPGAAVALPFARRLRRPRLIIGAGLGVIVVIVAAVALRGGGAAPSAPAADTATLTVTSAPASKHHMVDTLLVTGSLVPWQDLAIGTEASNLIIRQVLVDEGDHVEAGQLMAKLDDALAAAQLKQNEAQIEHARATIGQQDAAIAEAEANQRNADNDLKRAKELLKTNAISVQTAEAREATALAAAARQQSARMARLVAVADLGVAQSQNAELRARLDQTEIRAPAAGLVSQRNARIGNVVGGGAADLFHIIRDNLLELDANVPDHLLRRIAAGQKVRLISNEPDAPAIIGAVRLVAPHVDPATRNGIAHIRFPANDLLKDGMFVSGELLLDEQDELAVPQSAVVVRDGRPVLFVLGDGDMVVERNVETGQRTDGWIAITKGVAEGEPVILSGVGFLKDGDKVRLGQAG
jgi:RND family efflux transporter MFP subunit